ncbi:sugar transferase [Candidatus Saccharibacteria bacterium]|nr:sugar transferase [Candidatus Saccharibacteria bacterium]
MSKDVVERQISSYLWDGQQLSRQKRLFEAAVRFPTVNALRPLAAYAYYLAAKDQRSWAKKDVVLTQERLSGGKTIQVDKTVTLEKTDAAAAVSYGPANPHVTKNGGKARRLGVDEGLQYKSIKKRDILVVSHSRPILHRDVGVEAEVAKEFGLERDYDVVEAARNLIPAGFISPAAVLNHYPVDRTSDEVQAKALASDIRVTADYVRNASLARDASTLAHTPFVILDTRHGDAVISEEHPHLPAPQGGLAAHFVLPIVVGLELHNL